MPRRHRKPGASQLIKSRSMTRLSRHGAGAQAVPQANAVWAEDRILRSSRADIGVAVALDSGLLTPAIRAADEKSLSVISTEMRSLTERARDRKLKSEVTRAASAPFPISACMACASSLPSSTRRNPPFLSRCRAAPPGRGRGRQRRLRKPDDRDAVLRSSRHRWCTWRAVSLGIQEPASGSDDAVGLGYGKAAVDGSNELDVIPIGSRFRRLCHCDPRSTDVGVLTV